MPLPCLHFAIRISVLAVSNAGEAEAAKLMPRMFSEFLEAMIRRSFAIQEWQLDMCESMNARQRIEGYRLFLYYPRDAELNNHARALRLISEGLASQDAAIREALVVGVVGLFLPGLESLGGLWLRQLRILDSEQPDVAEESVEVTYGWYGWALGQCPDIDLGAALPESKGFVRRCILSGLAGAHSRYISAIRSLLDSSSMDREILISAMKEFAEGDYSPRWDRDKRMRRFGPVLLLLIRAMRAAPEPNGEVARRLLDLMEEILSEEIGADSH